jgi:hypothetical protein
VPADACLLACPYSPASAKKDPLRDNKWLLNVAMNIMYISCNAGMVLITPAMQKI